MFRRYRNPVAAALAALALLAPSLAAQQAAAQERGTSNITVLSHIPLGDSLTVSDIELEQDMSRPFAYVGRMFERGVDVIDLRDPSNAKVLHRWRIEDAALHQGTGMMDGKIFKHDGPQLLRAVHAVSAGRAQRGPGRGNL